MKKQVKRLLSVGLCLALALSVGGGLAACGGDDGDNSTQLKAGDLTPYWLAGKVKGTDGWDDPTDERRFVATETAGVYNLTLDLWKGDQFKIRYVDKGWDDVGGQLNASNNFDEEANGDTETGISGESGTGLGGRNFEVFYEGNYTVSITDGDTPMVTWVRNGDATEKAPIKVTGITVKDGDTAITSLTLKMGATATLTATVAPDNAADKTVTWGVAAAYKDFLKVENGVVTPLKVTEDGKPAKFYVEGADGISVTINVTIIAANAEIVEAKSITIPAAEKTQSKHCGETITVTPEILPANTTNKTVTYSVPKDSKVVTIADGVIKAAKPGTVTVTATVGEGANAQTDTFEVTVVRDYYIAGDAGIPAVDNNSWKAYTEYSAVPTGAMFTQDAQDATKYTLDINLYAGQGFKVLILANAFNGAFGSGDATDKLVSSATTDTALNISTADGAGNITAQEAGKYRLTLTVPTTGDPTLTYMYLEAAPVLAWNYDVVLHGAFSGASSWADSTAKVENIDKDNKIATLTVTLAVGDTFGIKALTHGTTAQAKWQGWSGTIISGTASSNFAESVTGGNITCSAAGTYTFTVTFDEDGNITNVDIVEVTAA